ncbi:AAA family ATPase [Trinickia sp. NRRL B-1857]|uniref:AAA family ATPase n=1 Tax=Trinickia sp. NRRL B-1857 TaxID=3162879 RepID=UPI003D2AD641
MSAAMAGIGKTRLVETFRAMALSQGFACHGGEFHDFGIDNGATLLAQVVCSLAGVPAGVELAAGSASIASAAARAFREWALPEPLHVFLLALLGAAPGDSAQQARYAAMTDRERVDQLQAAICHLMLRRAIDKPLLIAIEDLHWADAPTVALLARSMAATSDAPIVWVLTSRPEGDPLDAAIRPNFAAALSVLDVAPLRPARSGRLGGALQRRRSRIPRRVHRAGAGQSALTLTQLLANHESEFPDSLRHLVQTRVDRLAPAARNALRHASVLGHRFDLASLRVALGDRDYVPEQEIRQMMVKEIDAGTYGFVHDLVMQGVYESIPADARKRLHRTIAELYAQTDRALYAQHLARAGDLRACPALLAAMREKLAGYHYAQAFDLGLLCEGRATHTVERQALAFLRGQACTGLGRMSEACEWFVEALDLAVSPAAQIEAVLGLAPVLNALDRLDDEETLLEKTLPLAQAIGADVELARLLHLRGSIRFPQGDYVLCRQLHRQALRHARRARHASSEVQALSGIADSYYAQGRMSRAHALYDQCILRCESGRRERYGGRQSCGTRVDGLVPGSVRVGIDRLRRGRGTERAYRQPPSRGVRPARRRLGTKRCGTRRAGASGGRPRADTRAANRHEPLRADAAGSIGSIGAPSRRRRAGVALDHASRGARRSIAFASLCGRLGARHDRFDCPRSRAARAGARQRGRTFGATMLGT